jgi:L-2-hydroxyglutarate oxidase LhgO
LCVEGNRLLRELCAKHDVPHKIITKVITAGEPAQIAELEKLYARGTENGVSLRLLTAAEVLAIEPNIVTAGGIFSPTTGIISAHGLMDFFYHQFLDRGGLVQARCRVVGLEKDNTGFRLEIEEESGRSTFTSERVVNAAGLEADTVAALAGIDVDREGYRLHYCKGSYFSLPSGYRSLVSRLVYPAPTKHSLGVHVVLDLGGRIKFGPDVEFMDKRALDYTVAEEKRAAFGESARRILPGVRDEDLTPDMCGIRPKLQPPGGKPHDFVIREEADRGLPGLVNLIGIESPGLTAAPAIARYVARLLV